MNRRSLIVGHGYLGREIGRLLAETGETVYALSRHRPDNAPQTIAIEADISSPLPLELPAVETVYFTAAPDEPDEQSYRAVYCEGLKNVLTRTPASARRFVFASSTSVYGQSHGEWVDESSRTEPLHFRGKVMLEAETILRSAPIRPVIVRLGGIYGPGRASLVRSVRNGFRPSSPSVHTNRIHRDDAARLLVFVARFGHPAPIYNGVDDDPAELSAVASWIAERITPATSHECSPRSRAERTADRRCSNRLIREAGFSFRYPTYREGYAKLLDLENHSNSG